MNKHLRSLVIIFIPKILFSYSTHHFYAASSLWKEPRFEVPALSTIELELLGGSARNSFNCNKNCTDLLNIGVSIPTPHRQGYFEILQANINITQNIMPWFYLEAFIPLRETHIYSHVPPTTLSKSGPADMVLLAGITKNYINFEYIDYIDFSIQTGVLLPTGKKRNPNLIFDFSYGYNGHYGIPVVFDFSVGTHDWLTLAFHADYLHLLSKNKNIKWGNIHQFGGLIKADHAIRGFSLIFGLSYTQKNKNYCNNAEFITNNPSLNPWSMTTFNFLFEYDLAQYYSIYGPRIALVYNKVLSGKNIFDTKLLGIQAGLEIIFEL